MSSCRATNAKSGAIEDLAGELLGHLRGAVWVEIATDEGTVRAAREERAA